MSDNARLRGPDHAARVEAAIADVYVAIHDVASANGDSALGDPASAVEWLGARIQALAELARKGRCGCIARTFRLIRKEDPTGVSGTGHVADGVEFDDGTCVVRWHGEYPTTTLHGSLASVERIHLHEGRTVLEWDRRRIPTATAGSADDARKLDANARRERLGV